MAAPAPGLGGPPPAAMPATKDECGNGGWRSFGAFKNQGDCVSFVATGGKNPPAGPPRLEGIDELKAPAPVG
jgi:hypothetical protein